MITNQEVERILDLVKKAFQKIRPLERKHGPEPEYPDLLIIQLIVLKPLMQINSESSFLRQISRLDVARLRKLPERSRFNRRARSLKDQIILVQQILAQRLNRKVKKYKKVRIVDSKPAPVVNYKRAKRCKSFPKSKLVNFGKDGSTKQKFFGIRVHTMANISGAIQRWVIKAANRHDIRVLPELIGRQRKKNVVGDKGYISKELKDNYRKKQKINIITPYKKNMKQKNTRWEKRLLGFRKIIDTVFSQLKDHMLIERTLAKSYLGLETRIAGIILAHTVAITYNQTFHRPLLAIKSILT